jgi:AraC-like DNA-binding protein
MVNKTAKLLWVDFMHFIPTLILIVVTWDYLSLPGLEKLTFINLHLYDRLMPLNYIRAVHLLSYGILCIAYLYQKRASLAPKKKLYSIAICSIYFGAMVLISWLTLFAENWRQFIIFYFIAYSIIILIGYLLYTDPVFLKDISKKYLNSVLNQKDMNRIYKKTQSAFNNHAYLKRDLSLSMFSEMINERPHNISQTMSELVEKGFNDYVNFHRIEHAKHMLKDPRYAHYKIEAIAIDSGFNNKVTFNKAFVKFTAINPSTFRKAPLTNR